MQERVEQSAADMPVTESSSEFVVAEAASQSAKKSPMSVVEGIVREFATGAVGILSDASVVAIDGTIHGVAMLIERCIQRLEESGFAPELAVDPSESGTYRTALWTLLSAAHSEPNTGVLTVEVSLPALRATDA